MFLSRSSKLISNLKSKRTNTNFNSKSFFSTTKSNNDNKNVNKFSKSEQFGLNSINFNAKKEQTNQFQCKSSTSLESGLILNEMKRNFSNLRFRNVNQETKPTNLNSLFISKNNFGTSILSPKKNLSHYSRHGDHGSIMHNATSNSEEARLATRVTYLGLVFNVAFTIGKAIVGVITNSAALIADAVHSGSDLFSDIVTLWAVKIARRPHDGEKRKKEREEKREEK